ncbi:MAG: zinc ribbon domain-containing protein [Lachnospiraceae bacterium]|nr:zinc ribbon domain-containing protein [Lachnospiraceae bacterium]
MNEKLKEIRLYLCLGIIIAELLPWMEIVSKSETKGAVEASASATNVINGFEAFQYSFLGILVLLIPVALVTMEFVPAIKIKNSTVYLVGSILGIIASAISFFVCKSAAIKATKAASAAGAVANVEVVVEANVKIGFWVLLSCFVVMFVYTLIKDFAINKETLAQKGLKNAIKGVVGDVSADISNQVDGISTEGISLPSAMTNTCPKCGEKVIKGKKFCAKCGEKMPENEENALGLKLPMKGTKASKMITVNEYIKTLKTVTCDKCNTQMPNGTKFCPDCGAKVVVKIVMDKCIACGGEILKDKKFCPDCGNKIEMVELKTNCPKCEGELIFGKKYCVECGTKVE